MLCAGGALHLKRCGRLVGMQKLCCHNKQVGGMLGPALQLCQ